MGTITTSSTMPERGVRASRAAPVIIATDGRGQSDSAMVVGRLLAESREATRLVTVVKPIPTIAEIPVPVPNEVEEGRNDATRQEVIGQMARTWDDIYDFDVLEGDPAAMISRLAHETGATMIVAGLGRHRVADRVFGDETALRLVRMSEVPVFAASNGLTRAPRRIVVALDFSETSRRAARLALEVASSNATIYLAHVAPRDSVLEDWRGQGATYKSDAGAALQTMRDELRIPRGTMVQTILLQGDPATELLAFAASVNADL